jgi:hypothetical protein
MIKNKLILLLVYLTVTIAYSQEEKWLHGKIIVKDATPQGVHIINLVNEREAISDANGLFTILAKSEDLLVFSAVHLDYQRRIIEPEDFKLPLITIAMTARVNQLDEVKIIKYPKINALDLGILTTPAKHYTPAERRLKNASEFKPAFLLGFIGGMALPVEPIINAISGRTAMLKKELLVERRELLMAKISDLYEDDFYINKLKINKEYIKGFQLFLLDSPDFVTALKANNKTMISFLIGKLAVDYNIRINDENK